MRVIAIRLLSQVIAALSATSVFAESCPAPVLTNTQALRWIGQPLKELSEQGKGYAVVAVKADLIRQETTRFRGKYKIKDGTRVSVARDWLTQEGFACQFEVLSSVRADGVKLEPADLALYRCSLLQPDSCYCSRFQVTLSSAPQIPGSMSSQEYAASLNASTLGNRNVSYSCHDAQPAAAGDALPATPAGSLRPTASGRP